MKINIRIIAATIALLMLLTVSLCVYIDYASAPFQIPLESLPEEYSREMARQYGNFCIQENTMQEDMDWSVWVKFINRVEKGKTAFLRIYFSHSHGVTITDVLYRDGVYKVQRDNSRAGGKKKFELLGEFQFIDFDAEEHGESTLISCGLYNAEKELETPINYRNLYDKDYCFILGFRLWNTY